MSITFHRNWNWRDLLAKKINACSDKNHLYYAEPSEQNKQSSSYLTLYFCVQQCSLDINRMAADLQWKRRIKYFDNFIAQFNNYYFANQSLPLSLSLPLGKKIRAICRIWLNTQIARLFKIPLILILFTPFSADANSIT